MAIVNSLAIGKSVKSAGNLTYKTVRGRTIASQRITQNKSNTILQQSQRSKFGATATSIKLIQQYVDACYEKSKYGSARNEFFKTNKNFNFGGLFGELAEGIVTLSDAMLAALTASPLPQISIISKGTLAGFLNIAYKSVHNYKYNTQSYGSLKVIYDAATDDYNEAIYNFSFSSPVKFSDLKLLAFGFSDNGLISGVGTIENNNDARFDFGTSAFATAASLSKPYYSDETSGLVSSVDITINMSQMEKCPIAFIVPSVGGKVPSITGIFAKTSEV